MTTAGPVSVFSRILVRRSAITSARQLNIDLTSAYSAILGGVVALLMLRHIVHTMSKRRRHNRSSSSSFDSEKHQNSFTSLEREERMIPAKLQHRMTKRFTDAERYMTLTPLSRPWRRCGLSTPFQVVTCAALLALNVTFMLVSPHAIGTDCLISERALI